MKHIREKLGLSQNQMSALLGINRSSAAMYETGTRSLSTKQLILLSEIEILLNDGLLLKARNENQTERAMAAFINKLGTRIDKAAYECLTLKRKLTLLQNRYTKTENLWSVMAHLKLKMPENSQLLAYLEILEIECLEKMAKCGLDKQAEISLRIKTLEYEQAAAKLMIEGVKTKNSQP